MYELGEQTGKHVRRIALVLLVGGAASVWTNTDTGLVAGGAAFVLGILLFTISWLIE